MSSPVAKLTTLCIIAVALNCLAHPIGKNSKRKNAMYAVNVRPNNSRPVLDGRLSKNEWVNAATIQSFTQKDPAEGEAVSEPTVVLITYDEENIYFGIRCFDKEAQKIVATEMRRDYNLTEDDYFEIIIDTYHDKRNAYYFATNSLGARLDCEVKADGKHINWEWDGIWSSKAQKDSLGWTAEVAIPFQTLRFNSSEELTWGINFARYIPRKREEAFWAPVTRDDDFDARGKFKPTNFGVLNGLKNIKQTDRFQVKPYLIGGVERDFEFRDAADQLADVGLDTKVHLTSNLVADLTVNTDFAQVESDAEEVNLSRFSLFFPEKRDFFIEGLDIFNVGEGSFSNPFTLLFFSRRIGLQKDPNTFALREAPILGGLKTTGKKGPYEFGLVDVLTNDLRYLSDTTQVHVPRTNYSAVRIKRDIFSRSYIGFMGLSKDPADGKNYNRTFAIDGALSFDNNINLKGYFAKTITPGLNGKDTNGFAEVSWGTDKFFGRASVTDIGENFNPEMGFLQWTDIRRYTLKLRASPRPHFLNTRQTLLSYELEYITNHDDELQYRVIQPKFQNIFNNESYLFAGLANYYDNVPSAFPLGNATIPADIYKYNIMVLGYGSDLSRKFSGSADVWGGTFYNGTIKGVDVSHSLRPGGKLALDLSWEWSHVDVPFPNGKFSTSVLSARVNYSFNTDLFAKAFIQWNDFDNRILSNVLLRYRYLPGSDFYLVYNEELNTLNSFKTANRTLIAKLTYMLDL